MLDNSVEKITVSEQEIDIIAAFILNPIQLTNPNDAEHANPGIEFIWNDERARRNRLIEVNIFEYFYQLHCSSNC